MHKLKINQLGFSIFETILSLLVLLVLIVIISAIFSYEYSPSHIILSRQTTIDQSISNLNQSNYQSLAKNLYVKGYITNSLYTTTESLINSFSTNTFSSNPAYSDLICVDQIPHNFSYGQVTINGNTASLPVNLYLYDQLNPIKYIAKWTNKNGLWQLNSVSC